MLVLSRKLNESIRISDEIEVKVLKIEGNRIKLGIEAPRSVRIVRGELEVELAAETEEDSAARDEMAQRITDASGFEHHEDEQHQRPNEGSDAKENTTPTVLVGRFQPGANRLKMGERSPLSQYAKSRLGGANIDASRVETGVAS